MWSKGIQLTSKNFRILQNSFITVFNHNISLSGTYKLKKVTIQKEGFDPNTIKDKLYFLDTKQKAYVPLTPDVYEKIVSGEIRI